MYYNCLLYTSDAADEEDSVDIGERRILKNKKMTKKNEKDLQLHQKKHEKKKGRK